MVASIRDNVGSSAANNDVIWFPPKRISLRLGIKVTLAHIELLNFTPTISNLIRCWFDSLYYMKPFVHYYSNPKWHKPCHYAFFLNHMNSRQNHPDSFGSWRNIQMLFSNKWIINTFTFRVFRDNFRIADRVRINVSMWLPHATENERQNHHEYNSILCFVLVCWTLLVKHAHLLSKCHWSCWRKSLLSSHYLSTKWHTKITTNRTRRLRYISLVINENWLCVVQKFHHDWCSPCWTTTQCEHGFDGFPIRIIDVSSGENLVIEYSVRIICSKRLLARMSTVVNGLAICIVDYNRQMWLFMLHSCS